MVSFVEKQLKDELYLKTPKATRTILDLKYALNKTPQVE